MGSNKTKCVQVYVTTVDSCMTVSIPSDAKGKQLLEAVFSNLNIFERDWFGLYFVNTHNESQWLEENDKIDLRKIKPSIKQKPSFEFRIRYYPECIKTEIIHNTVKIYFFKDEFAKMLTSNEIYYPPEEFVLTVVAYICLIHKDNPSMTHSEILESRFQNIFTDNVLKRYELSKEDFKIAILSQLEIAKLQYYMETLEKCLSVIEQSPIFGVTYFAIVNKKGTPLFMGVHCFGMNIYRSNDKIAPVINFVWSEVNAVSFEGENFKIKMINTSSNAFVCYTKSEVQSKLMFITIIGAHKRYLARRANKVDNSEDIKEAKKAQEQEIKKMKAFEEQQKTEFEYSTAVAEVVETGMVDENAEKMINDSFLEAKKKMEEQILITQKEVKESQTKDIEKKAEMSEKLAEDEKLKNKLILLEQEKLSAQEAYQREIELLQKNMRELELKHKEDLKIIEKMKSEKVTLDENKKPPIASQRSPTLRPKKSYSEHTKTLKKDVKDKMNDFAKYAQSKTTGQNIQATQLTEFSKSGLGKFETLKVMRKNNTRARIDEFEALL